LRPVRREPHLGRMNYLKVNVQQSILTLAGHGWSRRRIARELKLDRATVRRRLEGAEANAAISTPGSDSTADSNAAISTPGSDSAARSEPATIVPSGSVAGAGRKSVCAPWAVVIQAALSAGLSAQRIYQDLVTEHSFPGSYQTVKRFVRKLSVITVLPFRRMEVEPGAEAQIDFGQGAWVIQPDGRKRRPHLLRVVLSHSRKGYSEVVWRQSTEEFIRGLENCFRHFGGVPKTLIVDNLKAAVSRVDWFDPQLNPKVREFCQHYGTVMLPTKPAMPRHKGKVEAGVKFAQNNALKERRFESLTAQNLFLCEWERTVADTRLHGTTRQQVGRAFTEREKPALLALPASLFPTFQEGPRRVHRDGHIELQKAFYSVPPEYVGRQVWARWEPGLVRIYNQRMEPIALHARHQPGQFSTDPTHLHADKRHIIERGVDYLLDRARLIGRHAGSWAQAMYAQRGVEGLRVLQGLLGLAEKHPVAHLEAAAAKALHHGGFHLRDLRDLLAQPPPVAQLDFLETHPLIRDLNAYGALLPACFENGDTLDPQPHTPNESHEP
jgi:transposase